MPLSSCDRIGPNGFGDSALTFCWALEYNIKLLHVVIHECDFVVAHHELHDIRLYTTLGAAHLATHQTGADACPPSASAESMVVKSLLRTVWRVRSSGLRASGAV